MLDQSSKICWSLFSLQEIMRGLYTPNHNIACTGAGFNGWVPAWPTREPARQGRTAALTWQRGCIAKRNRYPCHVMGCCQGEGEARL